MFGETLGSIYTTVPVSRFLCSTSRNRLCSVIRVKSYPTQGLGSIAITWSENRIWAKLSLKIPESAHKIQYCAIFQKVLFSQFFFQCWNWSQFFPQLSTSSWLAMLYKNIYIWAMLYKKTFNTKMAPGMVRCSHQRGPQEPRAGLGLPLHAVSTPVQAMWNLASFALSLGHS